MCVLSESVDAFVLSVAVETPGPGDPTLTKYREKSFCYFVKGPLLIPEAD